MGAFGATVAMNAGNAMNYMGGQSEYFSTNLDSCNELIQPVIGVEEPLVVMGKQALQPEQFKV